MIVKTALCSTEAKAQKELAKLIKKESKYGIVNSSEVKLITDTQLTALTFQKHYDAPVLEHTVEHYQGVVDITFYDEEVE